MIDDAFIYACGSGKQKDWSRENLIIKYLYENSRESCIFLKVKNIGLLPVPDNTCDNLIYYIFGYLYRLPKTQVNLIIDKITGRMMLEKEGPGFGYDEVEKEIYKFLKEQIKRKNIYIQTNLNDEEFLIK